MVLGMKLTSSNEKILADRSISSEEANEVDVNCNNLEL